MSLSQRNIIYLLNEMGICETRKTPVLITIGHVSVIVFPHKLCIVYYN